MPDSRLCRTVLLTAMTGVRLNWKCIVVGSMNGSSQLPVLNSLCVHMNNTETPLLNMLCARYHIVLEILISTDTCLIDVCYV